MDVDVVALIVSILAIAIALVAARYTKVQADAANLTARIEAERRHDELAPRFDVRLESLPRTPYTKLWLRLTTSTALTGLTVRLLNAPSGLQFTPGVWGVDGRSTAPVVLARAVPEDGLALKPHREIAWQLEGDDWPDGEVLRIEAEAQAGDETWVVLIEVATGAAADAGEVSFGLSG